MDDEATRRTFLRLTGAGLATMGLASVAGAGAAATKNGWSTAESGTGKTLYDAVSTLEGPYAVGSGGDILARRVEGWEQVLDAGPTTESNPLRGTDVTDDGRNVWFAGGSGVVAQYDVVDEELTDYSAPKGKTSTWLNVSVRGAAGDETVYLINGSGEFLSGQKTAEGGMDWETVIKPGSGSSAPGIDFYSLEEGYVTDTNSKVYRTTDGGDTWTTVGIDGASVGLYDVGAINEGDLDVAGGSGRIFRLNDGDGDGWKRKDVGGNTVLGLVRKGPSGLAAGTGGYVYDRLENKWDRVETPTANTLRGVALDAENLFPDAAVGSSGTIVERGAFEASPPDTITITGTAGTSTDYQFEVNGTVIKGDLADSNDQVSNTTVTGTVSGDADSYQFSSDIVDFAVTAGDPADLTITINGEPQTVSQLADVAWTEADSPTGETLSGATYGADRPYAVGDGGQVLARESTGWEIVVDKFPGGAANTLTCADASIQGEKVWFAGSSGAVGKYDTATGEVSDYSAPDGKTSTWEAIAVAGAAGSETIYLANGSGEVLVGQNSVRSVTWGTASKPGGGSSIKGADTLDASTGYFSDTNAKVYETTDSGDSYDTIGIDGGSVGLYGVGAVSRDDISVAGGDGSIFRYNGAVWTKLAVSSKEFNGIERDGENGLVVGGSGRIYRRTWNGWEREETNNGNTLNSVTIGTSRPDVAVGSSGTILERSL